ncbi:DNA-binding protein [Nocardioides eburneiflavus]|uniref:DNA-binding protein n=2 Tax=Nocardioides eburneiflavus TaxID=2518372 RepID=A0A4Z1CH64_9ACTN|nr:DNA-binding protein [Nocardioides eburneiflavus]
MNPRKSSRSPLPLMSTEELASYLNVPVRTIEKWREKGTAPRGFKVGVGWRYDLDDVRSWLAQRAA